MASMPSPPEKIPNWLDLPPEVTAMILNLLSPVEKLKAARKVCVSWRRICNDPSMWKSIKMPKYFYPYGLSCRDIEMMVDLSCGMLDHITLTFGTEKLFRYIADRSPRLRSLRVVCSFDFTHEDVCNEVAKKLQNLEELELFFPMMPAFMSGKKSEVFECFGRCCPKLKSLTYNIYGHPMFAYLEDMADEEALAIAQTMPGLRHLSLFGNQMSEEGLIAILKGCPHLESLDLRQCFNIYLSGDVGSLLCAKQIKNFKGPNDSTDGYEFNEEHTGASGSFV